MDYSQIQKGYYSGIAQIKLAHIVYRTDFRLFEVQDPYRPDFCNILHHITAVSMYAETSHAYPQCI